MTIIRPTEKLRGACTACDAACFDDGKPGDGVRVSFLLLDGTHADLTFCWQCACGLTTRDFVPIWQKVQRSTAHGNAWFAESFNNCILAEMGRKTWKELVDG